MLTWWQTTPQKLEPKVPSELAVEEAQREEIAKDGSRPGPTNL